jgi:hypothetical protein
MPGWNGIVVAPPSSEKAGLWLWLLAPLALPPLCVYVARPLAEMQQIIACDPFQMGPVSSRPPRLKWYAVQTAVLAMACATIVFVLFPSDALRGAWYEQALSTAPPGCKAALDALNATYVNNGNTVSMLGIVVPGLIFAMCVVAATYARYDPHP